MNWLLWREYRLNRWILATAAVAILLSSVIGFLLAYFNIDDELKHFGASMALTWSLLTVLLLSGNAFAGERADRSVEFIAYLPLQRRRMLASKWLLSLVTVVVLGIVNLVMLMPLVLPLRAEEIGPEKFGALVLAVSVALLIYGVNWLISSIQSSPALATLSGPITAMLLFGLGAVIVGEERIRSETPLSLSALLCLTIGVVCFCSGNWHYLRRGE